jgi:hypothetical protein
MTQHKCKTCKHSYTDPHAPIHSSVCVNCRMLSGDYPLWKPSREYLIERLQDAELVVADAQRKLAFPLTNADFIDQSVRDYQRKYPIEIEKETQDDLRHEVR